MILADTSVWIDHLRQGDPLLSRLLEENAVLSHPLVIGEIAMGNLIGRDAILDSLDALPRATAASDAEVMLLVSREHLFGMGIGFIDAHLLAATRLTAGASLWTRDKRLATAAHKLAVAEDPRP